MAEREGRAGWLSDERLLLARIVAEATDLCWKATPFGEDATGAITAYLLPAGVLHRLLGALQGAGYPAAFRVADLDPPSRSPSPQLTGDGDG